MALQKLREMLSSAKGTGRNLPSRDQAKAGNTQEELLEAAKENRSLQNKTDFNKSQPSAEDCESRL